MKTFEQFLKLKEAPMADYQGQQYAGMPGSRDDFAEPEDPTHPMQIHKKADLGSSSTDISDAFSDQSQYPKMFAYLYEKVRELEQRLGA